ncbi:MAG TPA: acyltransferase [Caulobacteraceae bacterium]
MKTLVSVQYLRAAAALAVVVFHTLQWLHGGFEVGRAGVDVFFVISGLIMWRITADKAVSPLAFLWRRVTRVAPAYWLATLTLAAIALAWPAFLVHVRPTWPHLALSLAFVPHNDPEGLPFPVLAPGWTLTYEAVFYLLFAAALAFARERRLLVVTSGLAAIAAAGFCYHPAYTLGANPMMLEFAAGAWLGKLAADGALPGRAWGFFLLGAGIAAFAALAVSGYVDELWRPLIWGVPALGIVAGAVSLEAHGPVFVSRVLRMLGDASYSIYLWHLAVIAAVAHTLGTGRPWLFVPAALAAAILAGLAGRAVVERPALAILRAIPYPRRLALKGTRP